MGALKKKGKEKEERRTGKKLERLMEDVERGTKNEHKYYICLPFGYTIKICNFITCFTFA